jgi:hypothetical protein
MAKQQDDDAASVSTTNTAKNIQKKEWIQRWIQKLSQTLMTDENKKMLHVFIIDPVLNHILERLFPYVLVLCVLFVVLTAMISLTLLLVFTRLPAALGATSSALAQSIS